MNNWSDWQVGQRVRVNIKDDNHTAKINIRKACYRYSGDMLPIIDTRYKRVFEAVYVISKREWQKFAIFTIVPETDNDLPVLYVYPYEITPLETT